MKYLYLLIIGSLLLGCGKQAKKVMVSENLQVVVKDSLIIEVESNEVCANESNFFVSEVYESQISCFNYQGDKLWSVGAKGSGPGEFSQFPMSTSLIGDYLVAADIPAFKIEIFHKNGEYFKSINYQQQMLSPIYHMFELQGEFYAEGTSLKMQEPMEMTHKVIKIDPEQEIVEEVAESKLRELASFEDLFKKMNPFQATQKYYSLEPDIAKIINPNMLRIYTDDDSTDISLASIPLEKVTQEIIDHLNESVTTPQIKLQFPENLPKINNLFHFDQQLLLLSEKQYYANLLDSSINQIYLYDEENKQFVSLDFPTSIPVHKISYIHQKHIFVIEEEKIKIYKCNFEI